MIQPAKLHQMARGANSDSGSSIGHIDAEFDLCDLCAKLNLHEILNQFGEKIFAKSLTQRRTVSIGAQCPFCRFVALISPSEEAEKILTLSLVGVDEVYPRFCPWEAHRILLSLIPHGSQHNPSRSDTRYVSVLDLPNPSESHYLRPFAIEPNQLPYERLKSWIHQCETQHTKTCNTSTLLTVTSFKLIQCTTRLIVPSSPTCQYVTLSYVWGPSNSSDGNGFSCNQLPMNLPKTIEDAITVTMELGFEYLWIDRYCIDQSNNPEKHQQLQQMGSIYRNAAVTIIAASGSDPGYGLPGVGPTPRKCQLQQRIGDRTFIAFPQSPPQLITKSVWMSRAWTYQEALLSRRRLFFTDEQIYFECQGLCREESFVDNKNRYFSTGERIFSQMELGEQPWQIFRYLADYTERNLTYEQDYLNGFLGVFSYLGERRHPIRHLCGVPILPPIMVNPSNGQLEIIQRQPMIGFLIGLMWRVHPGKRRAGFPSWSWTGWTGTVKKPFNRGILGSQFKGNVWIEFGEEGLVHWDEFERTYAHRRRFPTFPTAISIESEVFPISVRYLSVEEEPIPWTIDYSAKQLKPLRYPIPTGEWITWEAGESFEIYAEFSPHEDISTDPVKQVILQHSELKCLVIGRDTPNMYLRTTTEALVLRRIRSGFQRIGSLSFSHHNIYVLVRNGMDWNPLVSDVAAFLPKTNIERLRII